MLKIFFEKICKVTALTYKRFLTFLFRGMSTFSFALYFHCPSCFIFKNTKKKVASTGLIQLVWAVTIILVFWKLAGSRWFWEATILIWYGSLEVCYATHTHHKPIGLSYPISPSKTCWDTLYLGNGILLMNGFFSTGFFSTGFWEWRDFFRRDFENDWIFFDGILRTTGFFSTGFWERMDFERLDFESNGFRATGFWDRADWRILSTVE